MTLACFTRALPVAALLGFSPLALAQFEPVTPVPPNTSGEAQVIMTGPGAEASPAKPMSTKPCPIPTGSRIRPHRDANGRCPPESEEDVSLDTEIGGQIGTTAGLIKTQGN